MVDIENVIISLNFASFIRKMKNLAFVHMKNKKNQKFFIFKDKFSPNFHSLLSITHILFPHKFPLHFIYFHRLGHAYTDDDHLGIVIFFIV